MDVGEGEGCNPLVCLFISNASKHEKLGLRAIFRRSLWVWRPHSGLTRWIRGTIQPHEAAGRRRRGFASLRAAFVRCEMKSRSCSASGAYTWSWNLVGHGGHTEVQGLSSIRDALKDTRHGGTGGTPSGLGERAYSPSFVQPNPNATTYTRIPALQSAKTPVFHQPAVDFR